MVLGGINLKRFCGLIEVSIEKKSQKFQHQDGKKQHGDNVQQVLQPLQIAVILHGLWFVGAAKLEKYQLSLISIAMSLSTNTEADPKLGGPKLAEAPFENPKGSVG
jgi:hypothetical protein